MVSLRFGVGCRSYELECTCAHKNVYCSTLYTSMGALCGNGNLLSFYKHTKIHTNVLMSLYESMLQCARRASKQNMARVDCLSMVVRSECM